MLRSALSLFREWVPHSSEETGTQSARPTGQCSIHTKTDMKAIFFGSFGVFVAKLKSWKSMNKFKKFAMITDYDLNIFDYQGIKHAKRDCKLSIGGDEDENGPCQARRSRVADCG